VNSQAEIVTRGISERISVADYSMMLVVVIWGLNSSIIKLTILQIHPLVFTAFRFTIASILLAVVLRLREGSVGIPTRFSWRVIALGIIGNTLYQVLFILGLSMTTASNTALIIATTPAIVTVLGICSGVEQTNLRLISGIFLAFLGVMLLISGPGLVFGKQALVGDLLVLGSVICWSIYTLGVRSLHKQISSLRVTVLTILVGTPGLVIISLPWLRDVHWHQVTLSAWGGVAYAAILTLVVGYVLWNDSVHRIGGGRTSIYTCITPAVAMLVAWLVLNERPSPLQILGTIFIISGVLLTTINNSKSQIDSHSDHRFTIKQI